ncbi:MAG: DUF433 domain-containing protein [Balneolaceae bacterium]|nr:DUF433 domain-containing protein [Balneolaceae bacterium]
MSNLISKITVDPTICNGKPTIRGKRITVQTILEFLAAGDSQKDLLKAYPSLEPDDIKAALEFASKIMDSTFTVKPVA